MAYQVLARRWRPQRFADLLGQEGVVRTLQNALAAGSVGHAYLFSGLRGVGKTTAARLLARALNCERGPAAEPCGECTSCREVAAGSSLDVVELDAASNRGIDDVRELRELLRYQPARDRYRVIIVDEVHMLTREAFNALLKSLEEPPPHIVFILATTERHKVPATILSRCQQLEFRPLGSAQIAQHLQAIAAADGFGLTAEAADSVARAAEGSVRDGLSLLDQLRAFSGDVIDADAVAAVLGVPRFERLVDLVRRLLTGDAAGGLALLRDELSAGRDATVLYRELGRLLRSLAHVALDPALEPGLAPEHLGALEELAAEPGAAGTARLLGLWLEQEPLLQAGSNRELALEVACLRLARWPAVRALEGLLAGGGSVPTPAVGGGGRRGARPASGQSSAGVRSAAPEPERATPAVPAAPVAADEPVTPPSTATPAAALAGDLWEEAPQLASAVAAAEVAVDGGEVVLRLEGEAVALAGVLDREGASARLLAAAQDRWPAVGAVRVERGAGGSPLEQAVAEDPGVAAVLRVLGGEVVAVRPDRERPS